MTAQLKFGVLAPLEAKPGKAGETTYGIFDMFETEEARQAHLNGDPPDRIEVAPHGYTVAATQPGSRVAA